tara:strand:+ start:232 stop:381 length:150 start_codon:yes stop_codon:yes gene_type:complete
MPYIIKIVNKKYRLFNLSTKKLSKVKFKTKASATKQAKNYSRYDKIKKY